MVNFEVWKCERCGGEKSLQGARKGPLSYWNFKNHRKGCVHVWKQIK